MMLMNLFLVEVSRGCSSLGIHGLVWGYEVYWFQIQIDYIWKHENKNFNRLFKQFINNFNRFDIMNILHSKFQIIKKKNSFIFLKWIENILNLFFILIIMYLYTAVKEKINAVWLQQKFNTGVQKFLNNNLLQMSVNHSINHIQEGGWGIFRKSYKAARYNIQSNCYETTKIILY